MKPLSKHIQETLNGKPITKVEKKLVEEDLSDIMRVGPAKEGGIMKGTLRDEKKKND